MRGFAVKPWIERVLYGLRDLMFEKAQNNLRRIASRKRAQRNHPKAKHSHTRENTRRVSQMRHWLDWSHTPAEYSTHSGTIVLDSQKTNVYQVA